MARRPRRQVIPRQLTPRSENRAWYRIENRAGDTARIYLLDEIGFWGLSAEEFITELNSIVASTIELHISSPGGEVFSALAMSQALKDHPASIAVQIDGLAASAASFVAQAGDTVTIAKNGMMMVHDAAGLALGNAGDMREMADLLDKCSDNIASIYADSAGGTVQEWRDIMRAETWYSAEEAVAAGLADGIVGQDAEEEAPQQRQAAMAANFDLSKFRYPGRDAAPAPAFPTAHAEAAKPPVEAPAEEPPAAPVAVVEPPADPEPTETPEAVPEAVAEPVETPSPPDAGAEPPAANEDTWGALVAQLTATPLDVIGDALASLREATK